MKSRLREFLAAARRGRICITERVIEDERKNCTGDEATDAGDEVSSIGSNDSEVEAVDEE